MKTTKIAIWSVAVLLATSVTACKNEPELVNPHIILTTQKNVGENIKLVIQVTERGAWIDLNNNDKKDSGEEVTKFGSYEEYKLGSQTITIHGKIHYFDCSNNDITKLDVSQNPVLSNLGCAYNQITELDIRHNPLLEGLNCQENRISELKIGNNPELHTVYCFLNKLSEEKMGKLINGLPDCTGISPSIIRAIKLGDNIEANIITKNQVNIAKSKNWLVQDREGNKYGGS